MARLQQNTSHSSSIPNLTNPHTTLASEARAFMILALRDARIIGQETSLSQEAPANLTRRRKNYCRGTLRRLQMAQHQCRIKKWEASARKPLWPGPLVYRRLHIPQPLATRQIMWMTPQYLRVSSPGGGQRCRRRMDQAFL